MLVQERLLASRSLTRSQKKNYPMRSPDGRLCPCPAGGCIRAGRSEFGAATSACTERFGPDKIHTMTADGVRELEQARRARTTSALFLR